MERRESVQMAGGRAFEFYFWFAGTILVTSCSQDVLSPLVLTLTTWLRWCFPVYHCEVTFFPCLYCMYGFGGSHHAESTIKEWGVSPTSLMADCLYEVFGILLCKRFLYSSFVYLFNHEFRPYNRYTIRKLL